MNRRSQDDPPPAKLFKAAPMATFWTTDCPPLGPLWHAFKKLWKYAIDCNCHLFIVLWNLQFWRERKDKRAGKYSVVLQSKLWQQKAIYTIATTIAKVIQNSETRYDHPRKYKQRHDSISWIEIIFLAFVAMGRALAFPVMLKKSTSTCASSTGFAKCAWT